MTSAQAQYKAHQGSIQALAQQLQAKLATHAAKAATQPLNWGFAGDLGFAEDRLRELVDFFQN